MLVMVVRISNGEEGIKPWTFLSSNIKSIFPLRPLLYQTNITKCSEVWTFLLYITKFDHVIKVLLQTWFLAGSPMSLSVSVKAT